MRARFWSRKARSGFTVLELVVVMVIVAILVSLVLPALAKAKETGRTAVCKSNLRQLSFGVLMYVDENNDYFPWPGGVDRNEPADWVFGGQPDTAVGNPRAWRNPGYGFHAESGSVFSYVTGLQRVTPHRESHTNLYAVYRCPSSGAVGRALRVNFSLNGQLDRDPTNPKVGLAGVKRTPIASPSHKILLVNEDPATMTDAAFDAGTGIGYDRFLLHDGRLNVSHIDGHVETKSANYRQELQGTETAPLSFDPFY